MNNYEGKRIAFVDWSNYPYGGDTTYISEFKKLAREIDLPVDIYFYSRARKKLGFELKSNIQSGEEFLMFSKEDINDLFERLSDYDFISFVQTPHESEYSREQRYEILSKFQELKPLKGLQAHIFSEPQLAFSANLFDYIAASDVLITREDDNEVITTAIAKKLGKQIIPLTLYSDLDKYIDNSIEKKTKLLYRGRFDVHKRPHYLGKLSYFLRDIKDIDFELMGIDLTIGSFSIIHSKEWANTYRFPERTTGWVKVTKPFAKEDGIKEMQKCLFGYSPRVKLSGSYLEYSQIEVLQCGGILILSKTEGENSCLPDGRRWIDIPYFAIWLDEKDLESTAKVIKEVIASKELQKLYRRTPKELLAPTMDKELFKEHLNLLFNSEKKTNTVEEILRSYYWSDELIEKFKELDSQYIICPYVKYLKNKDIALYGTGLKKPRSYKDFELGIINRPIKK